MSTEDEEFVTPRPRPSIDKDDDFADAVKQLAPLLPPPNVAERRRDAADEVPTP